MSGFPAPNRGADEFLPPNYTAGSLQVGVTTAITTAAAMVDLLGTLKTQNGNPTTGACYVTFQARGSNVYMRFDGTTHAAGTTNGNASNGYMIANGTEKSFWITPQSRWLDVIGDAACSLFWWASSPNYQSRQPGVS